MFKSGTLLRLLLTTVIGAAALLALAYRESIDLDAVQEWIAANPLLAPLLFIAIYLLATLIFFPTVLVALMGGALFGSLSGTLFNLLGATAGASVAFFIARYLASNWVERHSRGRLHRLKQGVELHGWLFVALSRLVPVIPFTFANYLFGLTRIRPLQFIPASALSLLPRLAIYAYTGQMGRHVISGQAVNWTTLLIALVLLLLSVLLPLFSQRLRAQFNHLRDEVHNRGGKDASHP